MVLSYDLYKDHPIVWVGILIIHKLPAYSVLIWLLQVVVGVMVAQTIVALIESFAKVPFMMVIAVDQFLMSAIFLLAPHSRLPRPNVGHWEPFSLIFTEKLLELHVLLAVQVSMMQFYVILDEAEVGLMPLVIAGAEPLVAPAAMIAFAVSHLYVNFLPVLLSILA